jgi:hypothetical protein
VPRPPQPTSPILIVPLPAAWTIGTTRALVTAAVPAEAVVFRKSRLEPLAKDDPVELNELESGRSVTAILQRLRARSIRGPVNGRPARDVLNHNLEKTGLRLRRDAR